jgi:hypothetical protein
MFQLRIKGASSAILAAVLAVSMAGCSPSGEPGTGPDPDLDALKIRVEQRWQALSAQDYARVYEFTTPNYRRVFPKALFVRNFSYALNRELTSVEVTNYDARAAVASVAVRVMSSPTKQTSTASIAVGAVPMIINEHWLFIDGQWWHSANS